MARKDPSLLPARGSWPSAISDRGPSTVVDDLGRSSLPLQKLTKLSPWRLSTLESTDLAVSVGKNFLVECAFRHLQRRPVALCECFGFRGSLFTGADHSHLSRYVSICLFGSLVMRAAANKPNINVVAVNDPFIPVE
jgi:hypothetical protein